MAKLNPYIISMLSKKLGKDVTVPDGASSLAIAIESATGQHIGLNTIKRLVGILPYKYSPRYSTLEILAAFLGFQNWRVLETFVEKRISEFGENSQLIDMAKLPEGIEAILEWEPDRRIRIRHNKDAEYLVEEAVNSKLLRGDILTLTFAGEGFPLVVKSVVRNGNNLGTYTASPETGLRKLEIL